MLRFLEIDPALAGQYALEVRAQVFLARTWAERDPVSALKWVKSWPDGPDSRKEPGFDAVYAKIAENDLPNALRLFFADETSWDERNLQTIFNAWGESDGGAAVSRALQISKGPFRTAALEAALRAWTGSAPDAAIAWFHTIEDPILQREIATGLAQGIARTDLESAVQFARSLPAGRAQEGVIGSLADHLCQDQRVDEAMKLAASIHFDLGNIPLVISLMRSREFRSDAAIDVLLLRANAPDIDQQEIDALKQYLPAAARAADPQAFLKRLVDGSGEAFDQLRESVFPPVGFRWGTNDSATARSWMASLPPGESRELAFQSIVRGWTSANAEEAAAWIAELPESADRNAAIAGFGGTQLRRNPEEAIALIRSIPNEDDRLAALKNSWETWRNDDNDAAGKWRDTSDSLTSSERAYLAGSAK